MDKLEKMIGEDQVNSHPGSALDVETILEGTNKRIRFRRNGRRVMYSSPAVLLLVLVFYFTMPTSNGDYLSPGDEWIIAGLEVSSNVFIDEEILEGSDIELYDAGIEYVTDLDMNTHGEELDELFTEEDLKAFFSYLKET